MSSPPAPEPPASGLLGERYELLEPIGRGGMSTVHRAIDRALDRDVAVKLICHDSVTPEEREHLRERFRREAAYAARIPPHPNVVQIYDYGSDTSGDRDYIVMELLRGQDLKTTLRERRVSTAEAVRILRHAARGLAAGHRAGIVHRDVKPANLLLTDEGREGSVRVLDFGIAKALEGGPDDDLTRSGLVPHTPAYASPEQRSGRPLTPASDVYQLGLIAYELFTGERSFDVTQLDQLASGETVPLPSRGTWANLPAPLQAVVARALEADPADRYSDAAAFAAAIDEAWGGDTIAAAPPPDDATLALPPLETNPAGTTVRAAGHPPPRRARRRAVALTLVAGIAALLLWGALRGAGLPSPDELGSATPPTAAELEEDFTPLYGEAAERLAEEQ